MRFFLETDFCSQHHPLMKVVFFFSRNLSFFVIRNFLDLDDWFFPCGFLAPIIGPVSWEWIDCEGPQASAQRPSAIACVITCWAPAAGFAALARETVAQHC